MTMENTTPGAGPVGIGFTPFEDRPEVISQVAVHAEARGMAFVSVAEAMSLSAPIVLAQLAERTERIGLSTGVLSVWSRTPATLGLLAAELQRASGGRFTLGLGASTRPITEGFHGQRWQSVHERLEQTFVAVRALLRGERLPGTPDGVRPLRLACLPDQPVPTAMAAITPASIRLAGLVADQWLPFLIPLGGIDEGRELIEVVAAEHERPVPASVTASVPVALAADEEAASRIAALWLVSYTTRMGPVYPKVLRAHGYRRELDALLDANTDPRRPVLPAAATRLAEDVLLYGTFEDAPALCRRWQEHTDALALVAPFGLGTDELTAIIDAATREADRAGPVPQPAAVHG
jgi:alkanesulfonate monooxygenase SsuD/methylene tetrahydromethanopterin reductase-like flavin-dependent oxidoreductase (luciferase family)